MVGIIVTISLPISILFFIIRRCKNKNKNSVSDNEIEIEIEKQKYNEAQGYYRNQRAKQKGNQTQNQQEAQNEKLTDTQCQEQPQSQNPDQEQDLSKYYGFIEWLKQLQNDNQNNITNLSRDEPVTCDHSQKTPAPIPINQ